MNASSKRCSHVTVLLILLTLALVSQVAAEVRLFEVRHRPAADLVGAVQDLLGPEARVTAYRSNLLVNASPEEMRTVAELLAVLDRAPEMLRVTVEQGRSTTEQSRDLGGGGQVDVGSVRIGAGAPPPPGGVSVGVIEEHLSARAGIRDRSLEEKQNSTQFVTVLEGSPARIAVGRKVPFTQRLQMYCRRHQGCGVRINEIILEQVDTGFEVVPLRVGESIQLDIRPFMAFRDGADDSRFVFQEMVTRVVAPFGAWVDLAGQVTSSDELGREILGVSTRTGSERAHIRVRVDRP